MAAKLVPLLSRQSCFRLALALGRLMSILDRHGRKVALSNLKVAFGDRFSQRDREQIARESFQHFARTMLDLLWSPRLTAESFSKYIELENLEETARYGPERLFWAEDECDFGARVAQPANRHAHHSGAHRAARKRPLSIGVSSENRNGRAESSGDRAGLLEFVRTIRSQKPRAVALDV